MPDFLVGKVRLLLILAGCGVFVTLYLFNLDYNVGYAPEQPIAFSHKLHAGTLEIDCLYCHSTAEKSPHAGIPPMSTCMGCHSVVATNRPEIKKLTEYYKAGKAVPWVRIHRTADHAYFNHQVHLNAGVECQTCHGEIEKMEIVSQYRVLEMGDCLSCHRTDEYISQSYKKNPELEKTPYYYLRYLSETTNASLVATGMKKEYSGEPNYAATGMKKFQNAPTSCDICHQ